MRRGNAKKGLVIRVYGLRALRISPIRFNNIHTTQNRNLPYLKPNLGAVPCNMIAKVKKKKTEIKS